MTLTERIQAHFHTNLPIRPLTHNMEFFGKNFIVSESMKATFPDGFTVRKDKFNTSNNYAYFDAHQYLYVESNKQINALRKLLDNWLHYEQDIPVTLSIAIVSDYNDLLTESLRFFGFYYNLIVKPNSDEKIDQNQLAIFLLNPHLRTIDYKYIHNLKTVKIAFCTPAGRFYQFDESAKKISFIDKLDEKEDPTKFKDAMCEMEQILRKRNETDEEIPEHNTEIAKILLDKVDLNEHE